MFQRCINCIIILSILNLTGCMSEPWEAGWNQFIGAEQQGASSVYSTGMGATQDTAFQAGAGL